MNTNSKSGKYLQQKRLYIKNFLQDYRYTISNLFGYEPALSLAANGGYGTTTSTKSFMDSLMTLYKGNKGRQHRMRERERKNKKLRKIEARRKGKKNN